ncbi:MAG TPA: Sec-independent protein translocase protein TatB [Cellvibrionaceae bacterium]
MGFFELLLIAIVGLLVVGPERLPDTIRTVALWVGRIKRSLRETRSEIEKQLGADDIRRQLHNEEIMRSLESTRQSIENSVKDNVNQIADPERASRLGSERYQSNPDELPDHAHGEPPVSAENPKHD